MSGSAKRARPRLIRVRLADNLRGAPGGPADPNRTSGSPPPADRWSHGSPRGSTPGDDAGGERSGRVGALPPPFPPGRESLHASGRNSHGSYPQSPTVVKRTRRGVRFSKLATERALAGEMVRRVRRWCLALLRCRLVQVRWQRRELPIRATSGRTKTRNPPTARCCARSFQGLR
jgi:hypothetical protein